MAQTNVARHNVATLPRTWGYLRAVGDLLDAGPVRARLLAVVEGGIVGAVEDAARPADAYVALDDAALATLVASGAARRGQPQPALHPAPVAPTGYGDLLRALALWGHADEWTNLRLVFLPDRLWLSYGRRNQRQESVLTRENVDAVLDAAYRCRRDPHAPLRMPLLAQAAPREPGPWTVSRPEPYTRDLARVGRLLDREHAAEPLVTETDKGFLALAVGTDGLQRARLIDPAAPRGWGWRSVGECEAALAALGDRLDATGGHHPLLGIRPTGDWLLCSTVAQEPRVVSGNPLRRSREGTRRSRAA